MRKSILLLLLIASIHVFAQEEIVDMAMMQKIRNEGLNNSKVMEIAFHLTDVSGPRLTNSPGFYRAANWSISEMKKWGLDKVNLEPWGDFGKGWELQKSYFAMTTPYYKPLIAFPKTWTQGTNGLQRADVVVVNARDSSELAAYRGKLNKKIVMIFTRDTLLQSFRADANRFTDEQLNTMANNKPAPTDTAAQRRAREQFRRNTNPGMLIRIREMAKAEGAICLLSTSTRGHDGTLFVQGGGAYQMSAPENPLDVVIAIEDYLSIQRLVTAGIPVQIEAEVKTKFDTSNEKAHNVFGEINGTDS
jgi:hypothetical protein